MDNNSANMLPQGQKSVQHNSRYIWAKRKPIKSDQTASPVEGEVGNVGIRWAPNNHMIHLIPSAKMAKLEIVKRIIEVIVCDVLPVAMFFKES